MGAIFLIAKAWAKVRDGISSDEKTTPEERQLIQRMDGVIQTNAHAARSMMA